MSVHTKGGLPQPIHSRGLTRIKITLPAVSKILIMHHNRFKKILIILGREDDDDKNNDKIMTYRCREYNFHVHGLNIIKVFK